MGVRKVLAGMAVYIEGVSYIGLATFTPPDVEIETVESNQPGHLGTLRVPTGRLSELEAEVTVKDADLRLETLVGNPASINTEVSFVGYYTDGGSDRGTDRTERYDITGLWRMQSPGETGGDDGSDAERTYTVNVRTLRHLINGAEVRYIDIEGNIHRIGGMDVARHVRAALRI